MELYVDISTDGSLAWFALNSSSNCTRNKHNAAVNAEKEENSEQVNTSWNNSGLKV